MDNMTVPEKLCWSVLGAYVLMMIGQIGRYWVGF